MSTIKFGDAIVECVQGNIVNQPDMEAIVNAANSQLRTGGGVAGAIHRAAGPDLEKECQLLAPIQPGQAVMTLGYNLPNRFVIHCLGPVYGSDAHADELLASCYRNALHLAEENGIQSLAFPAISTGTFGFPLELAARIALKTILSELPTLSVVKKVRLVLFGADELHIHSAILEELTHRK